MQDQLLQTQILGVFEKNVNTKNGPKIMYEVQVEGGHTYTTFLKEIGDEAKAAVFQNVTMAVKVVQNGDWINRYIQKILTTAPGVAPVQPLAPQPVQAAQVQQAQVVTGHNDDGLFPPKQEITVAQANVADQKRQDQIHRQTACKVAAMLQQPGDGQIDFWQNVDYLIQFFAAGVKPLAVTIALHDQAA